MAKTSNQITFTEYKKVLKIEEWYLATPQQENVSIDTEGWTTDVQIIDSTNKYLWNYEKTIYSLGQPNISTPILIGVYSDSDDSNNIINILNLYAVSQNYDTTAKDLKWQEDTPILTPEDKYLWNYEILVFKDGTQKPLQPHIIGIYGDSGTNAITFEIYSTNGFIFQEDTGSIQLQTMAFDGTDVIDDAVYQWEYWDGNLDDGQGGYVTISQGVSNSSINIEKSAIYASANLRCTMTYNNQSYSDYVNLSFATTIYTAKAKFFDNKNIIYYGDSYIIMYVELYRNNQLIDTIKTTNICYDLAQIDAETGYITPPQSFVENHAIGDLVYFVIEVSSNVRLCALGEYDGTEWKTPRTKSNYIYHNSIMQSVIENIIVIPKTKINKTQNVDITVYDQDYQLLATTEANIIDSNDPIISSTEPADVIIGQLWLDTSVNPATLKIYTQTANNEYVWIQCQQQTGRSVYTSRPTMYQEGDLWILADSEMCNEYGPGSMLKATQSALAFNANDWVDANADITTLKKNIRQYFEFNATRGLKIGQQDNNFYVNISSTEMGFYDNTDSKNPDKKVVSIGNKSATINNVIIKDNANFKCNTQFHNQITLFDNYVLKKEPDGSLSLGAL